MTWRSVCSCLVSLLVALASLLVLGAATVPASASSVSAAVFTGGSGTLAVNGTLYAKQGGALTLTVTTSSDTKCVEVSGALSARQLSDTAKTSWTFTFTGGAGNGAQAVTVAASPGFNAPRTNCTGQSNSTQASYVADNTGPASTPTVTPAPNAAGWNNVDATVKWAVADAAGGVGVANANVFPDQTVTQNGVTTVSVAATADRLGNQGSPASVDVRIDKAKPTITGTETRNADGTSTVTFTCSDTSPGGVTSSGVATCVADGTSPASSSKTVPAGTTVTSTATDKAGNTATASFATTPADTTAPVITAGVSPAPNAAGWNRTDATVTFTCTDEPGGSGVASCVADGTSPASASRTVSTETAGLLVSGTGVDKAGNRATTATTVKLDKTAPTITASRDRAPNAAGWYDHDVTVSFACSDALSGVQACPAAQTLSQGANQSAGGSTSDRAGNTASAQQSGINVDATAPVLTGSFSAGWHTGDVTVTWTCTDALSGVAAQPADSTVGGEGADLSATTSCTDRAGNTTTRTVAGIQIDRTAPVTGLSGVSNSWVNGSVTVSLAPTDGLSGVAATYYAVDGGDVQTGTSLVLSAEGEHTVTYFSTDRAGNAESQQSVVVRIDRTAPTIGHLFTPLSYTDGAWTNHDVTVTFTCADQGGSGVASCSAPSTVSTEGAAQQVVGTVSDHAGNSATDTAVVSIDKTAPTITASTDRPADHDGWYDGDVTVSFACSDALSGVASCPAPKVLHEGANQSAGGSADDNAGNSAHDGVSGIDVDTTAPVLTGSFPGGWHTGDVTVTWTCTDALSGVAAQPADSTVTGEGSDLGATTTCTDRAGNSSTATVSGIRIDRTAPTTSATVSGVLHQGWYQAGVEVDLSAADNLSGVAATYYSLDGGDPVLYAAHVPVVEDGTHTLRYWSLDAAGNVEPTAGNSITLKIDKTAPTLTGTATTAPNGAGWYRDDVTVTWTCADATSDIDGACPADSTVGGEGDDLSASASVSDHAGNSTSRTVDGIRIDRTAPTTTAAVPALPDSGWYVVPVEVSLTGSDNLSGVSATHYSVDGGDPQLYDGPFTVAADGPHQVTFWSRDAAGNVETAGAPLTFRIDRTAPVTTVINPISPDSGWFVTSGIPFAFGASDAQSGVAATYYTIDDGAPQQYGEPFTADLSTGRHTVDYWSVDAAGNAEQVRTFPLDVDTIAPTITGSQSPSANGYGWNNGDVDVTFHCTDADSGIDGVAGCAGDTTLVNEGANQVVHGDAVDVAGNHSSTDYGPVRIDRTRPTLQGVLPAGARDGWYRGDVAVQWVGDDALSGIDPASQPGNSTVTGEGADLTAGPVTIDDKAGNESAPATVHVKIDRTAPAISGAPTTQPNAAGWYNSQVIVDFSCTDALSGVATCPTSKAIRADGANQSVTSDPASDVAGNERAGKTVGGINVDGTAPSTTSNNQCTKVNGWCTGSNANVVLTATDQPGLSGVKEIRYQVNGGATQVAGGATKTVTVPLDGSGAATLTYWAVDNADNREPANSVALKWDNIAPTLTHTVSPKPNSAEWNNADVTVHFDAKDDDAGSGVKAGSVTPDVVVSAETAGRDITGTAQDVAGNTGSDKVTVKLDKTAPVITGAIVDGTLGANGWYTSPVTVRFTCSDALSGIATCPDPVVLATNGASNAVARTATDNAGNTASATVSGIKIDQERPTLTTADVNVAGATYTLGAVPSASCNAADAVSGVDSCRVSVTGGNANGVGGFAYTAVATDKAGNTTTVTGSYAVKYRFDGFLQPINDTAHQIGVATSTFKAGSTVPAKFQLKRDDGTVVQSPTAPVWLTPVKGSATSAPVDETVYTASADSGTTYRYDATAQQYLYNWKSTSAGGNYWRVGVRLDDGQTYYVNLGLR
ncbi:OmpL47-type beta-barrel domain-containing protein [Nocardioides ginsengisoli]|uniref:OmpL47-type beta-barrel domain-containing protein n=1 Tax=Nocardioides ginsengisoli TaxID=363868 RepID=A0ABW3W327_9ACTN